MRKLALPEETTLRTVWLISQRHTKGRYALLWNIVSNVMRRCYGNKERNDSWRRLKRCLPGRDEKMPLMFPFVFLPLLIVFFSDSSFQKTSNFLNRWKNKKQDLFFCFLIHFNFVHQHLLFLAPLITFSPSSNGKTHQAT